MFDPTLLQRCPDGVTNNRPDSFCIFDELSPDSEHRLSAKFANCSIDPNFGCGALIPGSAWPAVSVYTAFGHGELLFAARGGRLHRLWCLRAPFHCGIRLRL